LSDPFFLIIATVLLPSVEIICDLWWCLNNHVFSEVMP